MSKNNKKNPCGMILIIVFLLFVAFYPVGGLAYKGSASTDMEKRTLAEFPEISRANYPQFSAQFGNYLKDHLPFRTEVTRAYNSFLVNVCKTSSDDAVILGKEGWLFYNSHARDAATNEIIDYTGESLYREDQLANIAAEVNAANEYCKSVDSTLVFVLAPNKSSVYGQYMPDIYKQVSYDERRIEQLYEYLCEHTDATIVYPREQLVEASVQYKTYFSNDTHWNAIGAYICCEEICQAVGLDLPDLSTINLYEDFSPEDLKGMLGVEKYLADNGNLTPNYGEIYGVSSVQLDERYHSFASENPNGKSMLLLGDSFSEKMIAPLSVSVTNLDAARTRYYQFAGEKHYDYVIYEMVERNFPFLAGE